ncbi:hypothetical protein J2T17_004096 [Paenibacillus mucilaginosus]|uniref:hypothetical protein n=1 Tax=Paenibacillus mucilaginosus TaxID=61624 RepID=UPI003D24CE61
MLRYWKLIVLLPLIVLVIGSYYATASGSRPEYVLKVLQGDASEAAPIVLQAHDGGYALKLSDKGSQFRSFWEYLFDEPDYERQRMIQEHRSFMRGVTDLSGVVYDGNKLVYAAIKSEAVEAQVKNQFRFSVMIMDEKSNKKISFELLIPNEAGYTDLNLHDIQIYGQSVNLFTSNSLPSWNGLRKVEMHRYVVDLSQEKLMKDQVILASDHQEKTDISVSHLNQIDTTLPKQCVVFEKGHWTIDSTTGNRILQFRELFVFDPLTDKLEQVTAEPVVELLNSKEEQGMSYNSDEIFLTSWADPKSPRVMRYQIHERKVTHDHRISLAELPLPISAFNYGMIKNNRMYMLMNGQMLTKDAPGVVIADLDSGRVVYEGVVSRTDGVMPDRFNVSQLMVHR